MADPTTTLHTRYGQTLILGVMLSILGGVLAFNLYQEWQRTLSREEDRLTTQARVVQVNIAHNLVSVNAVLSDLGKELSLRQGDAGLNRRLKGLSDAMPAMRTLLVLDAEGVIRASSREELIGRNLSQRAYFSEPQRDRAADKLYVSPPFRSVLGTFTLNVSRMIAGPNGEFAGVVSAGLDPAYFAPLMESVRYAPDMWTVIAHADGDIFMMLPEQSGVLGKNIAQPETFLSRHLASGQPTTVHLGIAAITGEERVLIWSTVERAGLNMDRPLLVAASRSYDEIFTAWRNGVRIQSSLYGLLVLTLALGLYLYSRRQREFDRFSDARAEALRDSEEKLRHLYELAPVGILLSDPAGKFLEFNQAFVKISGYTVAELRLLDSSALTPQRYAAGDAWEQFCLLKTGRYGPYEKEFKRKDGSLVAVRLNGVLADSTTGERNTWAIVEDISDTKRLQDSLREKMRELDAILDNSSVGIAFVKDRRQRWVNRRMGELFGYTQEEMQNQSTAMFHSTPEAYERLGQEAYPLLAVGRRYSSEQEMVRRDGTRVWMRISAQAMSADHPVGGSIWVFEDISERKHSEAELEQHRRHLEDLVQQRTAALLQTEARASHILNSSADGLYGIDPDGMVTFINPAACAMLGCSAEQVIGRSGHDLFHHRRPDGAPYPADECPGLAALRIGQQVRVDDEVFWHADGHPIPVMYGVHPMFHEGEIVGGVTSFVDVTEQRAATQARERALIAAENLARVRSEFLANMSHELRTPLNGVLGFADIGYRNYQNAEKARDIFAKIKISGNRLLGVINDVLDFSRIDAGKLALEQTEFVLADLVDHAVDVIRDRAQAKHLELRVEQEPDLPPICIGDPSRIEQVLVNVLSNAVKFTEAGRVTLSLARQGEQWVFRVSDTGIGMSAAELDDLFNPFQQADASSTRKFGGTGLGLAIGKRLLELMNGDIRVESEPGIGSVVEFRLPYLQPPLPVLIPEDPRG